MRAPSLTQLICSLLALSLWACHPPSPTPTNVLIILADDFGVVDPGFSGSQYYQTPHLDALAARSVQFTQGYANCAVCSPSRASILTGQFPARHGITDWIGARSGEAWRTHRRHTSLLPADYEHVLAEQHLTLAEAFQQAGYQTFFAGKWHLGEEGSYPEDHGFAINRGGFESGSPKGGYFSPWKNPSLPNRRPGENLSLRLADETVDFLEAHQDTQFLAYLSFYAVHGPIQTSQDRWQVARQRADSLGIADSGFVMESHLPIRVQQDNPIYAGLVQTMDEAIGRVLEALERLGLDENTIVVFTSDNGGVASGDAYATSNLPYRGGKGYQWEGGTRVPYLIHLPGQTESKNVATAATGADIYPTMLNLCDLPLQPAQHLDGQSLKPLIEGDTLGDRPLYWHYPHYGNQGGSPHSILQQGGWKLIHFWEDGHQELYHLDTDPYEGQNLAEKEEGRTQSMQKQLMNWLVKVKAQQPILNDAFDPALAASQYQDNREKLMPRLEAQRRRFLQEDFQPNPDWWGSDTTGKD